MIMNMEKRTLLAIEGIFQEMCIILSLQRCMLCYVTNSFGQAEGAGRNDRCMNDTSH